MVLDDRRRPRPGEGRPERACSAARRRRAAKRRRCSSPSALARGKSACGEVAALDRGHACALVATRMAIGTLFSTRPSVVPIFSSRQGRRHPDGQARPSRGGRLFAENSVATGRPTATKTSSRPCAKAIGDYACSTVRVSWQRAGGGDGGCSMDDPGERRAVRRDPAGHRDARAPAAASTVRPHWAEELSAAHIRDAQTSTKPTGHSSKALRGQGRLRVRRAMAGRAAARKAAAVAARGDVVEDRPGATTPTRRAQPRMSANEQDAMLKDRLPGRRALAPLLSQYAMHSAASTRREAACRSASVAPTCWSCATRPARP